MNESNKTLAVKKEKIINFLGDNDSDADIFIQNLLLHGKLDKLLTELDNKSVKTNCNSIIKKGYLTSEEQFAQLLQKLIITFYRDFWFIGSDKNTIIKLILENDSAKKFLYSKKYLGNNDNISYYEYNVHKVIIIGFYNVIKGIFINEKVDKFFKENNIDYRKINITSHDDTEKLYTLLIKLLLVNHDKFSIFYLFDNGIKDINWFNYLTHLEILIDNYYKKKDILKLILE